MPKAYLETTVISYVAARPSRDLIVAANQQVSKDWWENRRSAFDLFVSELVIREAAAGDEDAATRRKELLSGIRLLDLSDAAIALGRESGEELAAENSMRLGFVAILACLEFTMAHKAQAKPNEVVSRDPDVHSGDVVFAGTRVPVDSLVDALKAGQSIDDFLEGYPSVARWQVEAFLDLSPEAVDQLRANDPRAA